MLNKQIKIQADNPQIQLDPIIIGRSSAVKIYLNNISDEVTSVSFITHHNDTDYESIGEKQEDGTYKVTIQNGVLNTLGQGYYEVIVKVDDTNYYSNIGELRVIPSSLDSTLTPTPQENDGYYRVRTVNGIKADSNGEITIDIPKPDLSNYYTKSEIDSKEKTINDTTDSMQNDIETLQTNDKENVKHVTWIQGGEYPTRGTLDINSAWVESATQLKSYDGNNLLTINDGRIEILGSTIYKIQSPNDTSSVIFGDDIPNMHTVSAWVESWVDNGIPISTLRNFDGSNVTIDASNKTALLDSAYVSKANTSNYSTALSCHYISGVNLVLLAVDNGYEFELSGRNGIIKSMKLPSDYSTALIADADISAEREVLANISGNILTSINDGNGHTFTVSNKTVSLDGMIAYGAVNLSSTLARAYMSIRDSQISESQAEIKYTSSAGYEYNVRYNKSGLNVVDANLSDYVYSKDEIDTKIGDVETLLASI